MPKYRVLLEKTLGIYRGQSGPINPFSNFDIFDPGLMERFDVREFIFEAKSEDHVKRLLQEAREADIPDVRGYQLRSIEELPERK